jgi:hypothetical protein
MFPKCAGSCLSVVAWEFRPAEIMAKSKMLAKNEIRLRNIEIVRRNSYPNHEINPNHEISGGKTKTLKFA